MVGKLVVQGTSWETYELGGTMVHVKREDMSCPFPGPAFSKIRGVEVFLRNLSPNTPVGVLDTAHSKAGWGVAYICETLGLPCYDFYPVYKGERDGSELGHCLRYNQQQAAGFGAELVPLVAGRSAILYHRAKKMLSEITSGRGVMLPNALKLSGTVEATAREVCDYTPRELLSGTWVVSISSGTIAAGVLRGLAQLNFVGECIAHMGYSRSAEAAVKYMVGKADVVEGYLSYGLRVVDEGYSYKDKVDIEVPFPCNEYYDAKAWLWLSRNVDTLTEPITFWNIGD